MVEMSPEKLTAEKALVLFRHLPPDEQRRFRKLIEQETLPDEQPATGQRGGRRVPPPVPYIDRTREMNWLTEHANEFAKKWVALNGDTLIACGETSKEVYAAADAAAIERPFVVQVEDPNELPFAGW